MTSEEWAEATAVLETRSVGCCECCGTPLLGRMERHHRQRRRDGGDVIPNLLALLPAHHTYITEHPKWAVARGLIVPTWADPSTTPVFWRGTTWVLLNNDGTTTPTSDPNGANP